MSITQTIYSFSIGKRNTFALAIALLLLTSNCSLPGYCAAPAAPARTTATSPNPVTFHTVSPQLSEPGVLLGVTLLGSSSMPLINTALQSIGCSLLQSYSFSSVKMMLLKISIGQNTVSQATQRLGAAGLMGIQPNWQSDWCQAFPSNGVANDQYFPSQTYLKDMSIPSAWQAPQSATAKPVYIAFLDSGCSNVPELSGKLQAGSTSGTIAGTTDTAGHGTMLATIAAAATNNRYQIAAVNPNAYVYPINITRPSGGGTDDVSIIIGLDKLITSSVKIAVIGAAPTSSGWTLLNHPLVHMMLGVYAGNGGLAFAPAGNAGMSLGTATQDQSLLLVSSTLGTIGSIQATGQTAGAGGRASFSNYGPPVWFAAPGCGIYASSSNGTLTQITGTSASCAIAAGIASLVWSFNPGLTSSQVLQQLETNNSLQSAASGSAYGVINANLSVRAH